MLTAVFISEDCEFIMKTLTYSAVVIGSGCAGYSCADRLYDFGVTDIALITEGRNMGTSRNTGSDKQTYYKISLCGDDGDSVIEMAKTLFSGGSMDGDNALCEAANSARCFMKLTDLGVPFPTNEYGEFVGYKTDHDPSRRATSIGPYTSKRMTEVLEKSVLRKNIPVLEGYQVIKLLVDDGKITGLLMQDLNLTDRVEIIAVKTPYVVLCTGGPAGIYRDTVYPESQIGASGLALDIGAAAQSLCEWQYGLASVDFRWNVSGTYQQVLPRYVSIDENGLEREFLSDYMSDSELLTATFLKGYQWPFDVRKINGSSYIDLLVYNETVIKNRSVYLDFTREPSALSNGFDLLEQEARNYLENSGALIPLPIERLKKMNQRAIDLYADHRIDITKEPLRIAVCAQHNNGGISVGADYQTTITGLYSAGEAAGTFGIFRPGGSALNSTQVGSLRAAEHIAFLADNTPSKCFESIAEKIVDETKSLLKKTEGNSTVYKTRGEYQSLMSRCFSFIRDIGQMEKGVSLLEERLKTFCDDNRWSTPKEAANLLRNYDILLTSEAVAKSMLYSAKKYGSHGSAFVIGEGGFMDKNPKPSNDEIQGVVITAVKESCGSVRVSERPVRPIPERDLWFERVWNNYIKTHDK